LERRNVNSVSPGTELTESYYIKKSRKVAKLILREAHQDVINVMEHDMHR
jgi:hypothetical protein